MIKKIALIVMCAVSVHAVETVEPVAAPEVPLDPIAAALGAYSAGNLDDALSLTYKISDPAAKYFVQGVVFKAQGKTKRALQSVVKVIVRYPQDETWLIKSELLGVVLYMELGMLDAADVSAHHMELLHEGTDFAKQASALRSKIEKMKNEMESEGSTK